MMKLVKEKDGTVSLNCTEESMKKVISIIGHCVDDEMSDVCMTIDYDSPMHPDNCMDIMIQEVCDVHLNADGSISAYANFVVNGNV